MCPAPHARGPFIALPNEMPGIASLMAFKPETGDKMGAFVQQILRGPSSLSPGEREVIAALVPRARPPRGLRGRRG